MLDKIKQFFKFSSETGLRLPFIYDPTRSEPSVTLLFVYLMFIGTASSLFALHFSENLLTATLTTAMVFFVCFVFYLVRTIARIKFDLDERSVDITSGEKQIESINPKEN